MISPLLAAGIGVRRLCWVRHGPVVLAAGGSPINLDGRVGLTVFVVGASRGCLAIFLSPIISFFFLLLYGMDGYDLGFHVVFNRI